jgi:uncharacterized membrane protein YbhN (UPF0104 family)
VLPSGAQRAGPSAHVRLLLTLALLGAAALAVGLAWPALQPELAAAATAAEAADGRLLALAGVCFALAPMASGLLWAAAIGRAGGRIGPVDACARFGIGSLLNSVAPMHLGGAVRTALLLEPVAAHGRRRVAQCLGTVQVLRLAALTALVLAATVPALAPLPLAACLGTALLARRAGAAHLFLLGQLPMLARLAAATTVLYALGAPSPLRLALAAVAALELAAALPLTPGNLGVTSAAAALALGIAGAPEADAVTAGIVLHGVETVAGVSYGATAAAVFALLRLRRHRYVRPATPVPAPA